MHFLWYGPTHCRGWTINLALWLCGGGLCSRASAHTRAVGSNYAEYVCVHLLEATGSTTNSNLSTLGWSNKCKLKPYWNYYSASWYASIWIKLTNLVHVHTAKLIRQTMCICMNGFGHNLSQGSSSSWCPQATANRLQAPPLYTHWAAMNRLLCDCLFLFGVYVTLRQAGITCCHEALYPGDQMCFLNILLNLLYVEVLPKWVKKQVDSYLTNVLKITFSK